MILCNSAVPLTSFWESTGWSAISAISALAAAVIAGFYTYYTYHLLKANKTSVDKSNSLFEFQIYSRLSDKLDLTEADNILRSINSQSILIGELHSTEQSKTNNISGLEVMKWVLNPLEDLAKFYEDGLISEVSIDNGFGYIILSIGNCKEVIDYINYLRNTVYMSDTVFIGIQRLYELSLLKCSEDERKRYQNYF